MLITSTPNSKGDRIVNILCKELGVNRGNLEIDPKSKKSKGWEDWPMDDGITNSYTSVKKWVTSKDEIYHTHLLPNLKSHTKALGFGNAVSILRDPLDIIGDLPIEKRDRSYLDLLRVYHEGWTKLSKRETFNILLVDYRNLTNPDKGKSTLVGIAKHLGLDWKTLQGKPYGFKI